MARHSYRTISAWSSLGIAAALAVSACNGVISDPGGEPGSGNGSGPGKSNGATPPGTINVAATGLGRMTPTQYENTVRDLFASPKLVLSLDPDTGQAVSRLAAEKFNTAAEEITASQGSWGDPIFPCDTSGSEDSACVDTFISDFGKRAFRRPVTDEEKAWLRGVYDTARKGQGFRDSLFVVLQVMLQSPQFLYFLEVGRPSNGKIAEGVKALTGFERATRLSYFLWNTTPDTELLLAAEKGELESAQGVKTHALRLLADPRARSQITKFFIDWLELTGTNLHGSLAEAAKDPALFPEDSPSLRAAMETEVVALVERVVLDGDGKLSTLLTTTEAYVNEPLATLYGVAGPKGAQDFQWLNLPATERAGLFTRAAFATLYASPQVKSPIRRGAFLVEKALCVHLGEPPPNANDVPVTGGSVVSNGKTVDLTVREDVEAKTSGPGCNGCHQVLNPIGFAFDLYDALGRYHDKETGTGAKGAFSLPVDASGGFPVYDEEDNVTGKIPVNGAVEFSEQMSQDAAVQRCFARNWFEHAFSRLPVIEDTESMRQLSDVMQTSGRVDDLIIALTVSDAFLYVKGAP
ncbi:MAG TPA: DUF1592 domain-containing protein [Polyangiaceae bacterium]|nr:DUF1592 domain-containing protein [Polyangiaceae bacterium]